jgi:hypothetical protein
MKCHENHEPNRVKKTYIEPVITSCEVAQEAYACGSAPGSPSDTSSKWLQFSVFFSCCDQKILFTQC